MDVSLNVISLNQLQQHFKHDNVWGQVETIEHLFFECDRVSMIWSLIEAYFKIKIRSKHLILGYYNQMNNFTILLNYLIAIVLFTIYKHWCINRKNENHFTNCLLKIEIKKIM